MEVITGASVIREHLRGYLRDWVDRQGAVFRTWQRRGMMAELPTEHVFFALWALTQTYADFAPQVTAVLGEIGRAHVRTPVTNAPLACRRALDKNQPHKDRESAHSCPPVPTAPRVFLTVLKQEHLHG